MDIDSDCTGAMKYVRVMDPVDQRTLGGLVRAR